MEKLICPACGAPITPDNTQPFLTCEYCDTSMENKYYVAPAVKEPAEEPVVSHPAEPVEAEETPAEEESSGGSLLKTLIGVGTAIAANSARKRARAVTVHRPSAAKPLLRTAHAPVPHRHPEPPRQGGVHARPTRAARPGSSRPSGFHGGMPGRGIGGPGGRGGRGGMGGPGGRHR